MRSSRINADQFDPEVTYDQRRASEEHARAITAKNESARAAHQELAVAYEKRLQRREK